MLLKDNVNDRTFQIFLCIGGYNNYASDRSRPYGPPQAVDMPFGYKQHGYDWNGGGGGGGNSGHGLDWGHGGGYGGGGGSDFGSMLEEKFSVSGEVICKKNSTHVQNKSNKIKISLKFFSSIYPNRIWFRLPVLLY